MTDAAPADRRLTMAAGGWVILVTAALCAALLVWAFAGIIVGHRPKGGSTIESYGFDLSRTTVPTSELTPTGETRDFLRALDVAAAMPASEMLEFNRTHRKRYVVSDDRVIVVTVGEETRAYPISVVEAHEIVHDTLGGVPIAVTYSPFCDAVSVFDRRFGDSTLHFGVSGIVRDANTVLYSVAADGRESLWQQLDGRALSGDAAAGNATLTRIPAVFITTWADYLGAFPNGSVMVRDEKNVRLYQNISYERAHESPTIEFPVRNVPPQGPNGLTPKSPILVLQRGDARRAVAIETLRARGTERTTVDLGDGRAPVTIVLPKRPGTARVLTDDVTVLPTFWFAAHSLLGIDDVVTTD
ncbi:MAG: DUF3179 domain-containing protein [Phycisphaerae bacterium]|nr:DUF3179 domain-containing protein [Phycisphaerae bacterium]